MKTETITYIPVEELYPHPYNPRKDVGDVTELAESIRSKGIMQNLTVVPRAEGGYTVIIGHRRCAAANVAGLESVPCIVVEMSGHDQVATMLLENMQRVDLTAYEQAQGFQMMIDFGESVESISQKTGFSKKTVRGRLKMAELDAETLREVSSERQISIADFEKLSQIEDIDVRNELLDVIGTNNFEQALARAIRQQKIAHALPGIKDAVAGIGAERIERTDTYAGKYQQICRYRDEGFTDFGGVEIPEEHKGKDLYYYLDESWGELVIYVLAPKREPKVRPREEIDREMHIREAYDSLAALSKEAYKLRHDFVRGLRVTKDNADKMHEGLVLALITEQFYYNGYTKRSEIYGEGLGIDEINTYNKRDESAEKVRSAYTADPGRSLPQMIYVSFDDREYEYFFARTIEYPKHKENKRLVWLYEWLVSLGYEMSDDERMLLDGTHPLFEDKEDTDA